MMVMLLILEDGTILPGYSFGAPVQKTTGMGEVIFNTAMSGYHEVLTDPSYHGQIVAMTYPLMGNYGTDERWSEIAASDRHGGITVSGLVSRSLYRGRVPSGRNSLEQFLIAEGVPGIDDVDTRRLTLAIRENGELRGGLFPAPAGFRRWDNVENIPADWLAGCLQQLQQLPRMSGQALAEQASSKQPHTHGSHNQIRVALLNCGAKAAIVRHLTRRGCLVELLPAITDATTIDAAKFHLVVISNGPGDPRPLERQINVVKQLIGRVPLFGICLGHQLLAEALGGVVYKMKFGHHGVNHPVRNELTGSILITSQNHGFAVEEASLPDGLTVWFRNANDQTIEGLCDNRRHLYSTQFHPESSPGPDDAGWIFDWVLRAISS